MVLYKRKTSLRWFQSRWIQQLRDAGPSIFLLALSIWLVSLWLPQFKTLVHSQMQEEDSLWLVSLLKNTANFSSDPQWSCPYVLSARDIADAWAYVCYWHISRINMTGLNWSSFTIEPWWWDVCLTEDTRRKGEYADICQQGEKRLRRPSGSPAPWINCELNIHEEHPCLIRKI